MGRASGMIGRWGVATSIAVLITLGPALADVTTERGSSIIMFPKVLSDAAGLQTKFPIETIIQITNTSNSLVFAHCFYVRATPNDASLPPSAVNLPQWVEIDFDIVLTKQQPTHWLVGPGRQNSPNDSQCSRGPPAVTSCNGAGFDPGPVPPTDDPFVGYLVCLEVDNSGAPINGNHLQGEATLVTPVTATGAQGMMPLGEVSKYNAVGIPGLNTDANSNDSDLTLCLGGGVRPGCPGGAEYSGCPQTVIVNHFAENATDPAIETLGGQASNVQSELTLVPCTQDFETQVPPPVVVQFLLTNEFETLFSTSTTITCWSNFRLDDVQRIFDVSFLGTRFVQTQMTAFTCPDNRPDCVSSPGFVGVLEEFHRDGSGAVGLLSRAALNLHGDGERPGGDVIIVPEGP